MRQNVAEPSRPGAGLGWRSPHAVAGIACFALIGFGLVGVQDLDLSPADGLGYGLGIAGLSMMALLLLYSLRKRVRALRRLGSMRGWFEFHLVLGLLGPTLILYHSNFGLGSANATISLACVLAVSGSGIGGRFLYGRMHRGLAGERRSVQTMRRQARRALEPLEGLLAEAPAAQRHLARFEASAVDDKAGLLRSFSALWRRPQARLTRRRALRALAGKGGTDLTQAQRHAGVSRYLSELCRAGELRLFEQLFALWHAIHVPLTIILFVSAAVHVVAVHLY